MLKKVSGLARALGLILAVVSGFVTLGFNTGMVLVVLGLVSGISNSLERMQYLAVMIIALPLIGTALTQLPEIGSHLASIAGSMALLMSGSIATGLAMTLFATVKGDLMSLKD